MSDKGGDSDNENYSGEEGDQEQEVVSTRDNMKCC